jgi:hypothetical protein
MKPILYLIPLLLVGCQPSWVSYVDSIPNPIAVPKQAAPTYWERATSYVTSCCYLNYQNDSVVQSLPPNQPGDCAVSVRKVERGDSVLIFVTGDYLNDPNVSAPDDDGDACGGWARHFILTGTTRADWEAAH